VRKIALILFLILTIFQLLSAQVSKLYVSRKDGTKTILSCGKLTYNYYRLTINCELGDSLICSDPGYEACKIDKNFTRKFNINSDSYKIFNKAIKVTEKHIKKTKLISGYLKLKIKNKEVIVTFYDANSNGEADFDIQIL